MGLISRIFANTRRPEGWIGRLMVAGMNGGSHAKLAVWGLFHAPFQRNETVLEKTCQLCYKPTKLKNRRKSTHFLSRNQKSTHF